jgi:uncharacterized protein
VRAPRVVLDTQVCLDLWLFADPRVTRLRAWLDAGAVVGVRDDECRAEWLRVLRYPAFGLDDSRCAALERIYDASLEQGDTASAPVPTPPLPRCSDPDDQKFLALAWATGAAALLTRDAALLALARRVSFAILTPALFELAAYRPESGHGGMAS